MDKTAPVKEAPEVTRESLIALSYSLPDQEPPSNDTFEKFSIENTTGVIDTDGKEKFRCELISLSYLQTPEAEELPQP